MGFGEIDDEARGGTAKQIGDKGAGRRAREKIKLRKKEEGREAGEREKENRKCLFNERRERSVIYIYIYIFFFFFFLSYSAHLKILALAMHCS